MTLTQAMARAEYLAARTGEDYQVLEGDTEPPLGLAYYILSAGSKPSGGFTPDKVVYCTEWTLGQVNGLEPPVK